MGIFMFDFNGDFYGDFYGDLNGNVHGTFNHSHWKCGLPLFCLDQPICLEDLRQ